MGGKHTRNCQRRVLDIVGKTENESVSTGHLVPVRRTFKKQGKVALESKDKGQKKQSKFPRFQFCAGSEPCRARK